MNRGSRHSPSAETSAASGQLVPESLRGHVRKLAAPGEAHVCCFSDIIVAAKPPSLSKRAARTQPEGANRYRLLFSVWNSSTLSYVTWQHMQARSACRSRRSRLATTGLGAPKPCAQCVQGLGRVTGRERC